MLADIPVVRAYLMLYAPLGTHAEEILRGQSYTFEESGEVALHQRGFIGRGSSFSPSFFAYEIFFEQKEYDQARFERGLGELFSAIGENRTAILRMASIKGVLGRFVVNINSQKPTDRPAFDIDAIQLKLLSDLGVSFSFDGYLMFGD